MPLFSLAFLSLFRRFLLAFFRFSFFRHDAFDAAFLLISLRLLLRLIRCYCHFHAAMALFFAFRFRRAD